MRHWDQKKPCSFPRKRFAAFAQISIKILWKRGCCGVSSSSTPSGALEAFRAASSQSKESGVKKRCSTRIILLIKKRLLFCFISFKSGVILHVHAYTFIVIAVFFFSSCQYVRPYGVFWISLARALCAFLINNRAINQRKRLRCRVRG